MNKQEIGKQRIKAILGNKAEAMIAWINEPSTDFANCIIEYAYGDIYTRKGLSNKQRKLSAVVCLIGQ